jgi:hypothetical protein
MELRLPDGAVWMMVRLRVLPYMFFRWKKWL